MLKNVKNNWYSLIGYYDSNKGSKALNKHILQAYNAQRPKGPQKKICYAPFRNLYFGYGGNASACCYGRDFSLGKYPDQTIMEIWKGEKADLLRGFISNNNLDNGCLGCLSQLLAENFDSVKTQQYDEYKGLNKDFPSVLELELSNTCNLECEMCSGVHSSLIRQNREQLPPLKAHYDDEFVRQLEAFLPHLEEIKFYGGEPFLINIYYQIWDKVIEINPQIRLSVQTNGTILNKRVESLLSQSKFHINLSIDSLQKDRYNKIRQNARFDRVMENLKWFYNYCKSESTFFGISMCAMKENWEEIPRFVEFANDLQVSLSIHTVTTPKHMAIRDLSYDKLSAVYEHLKKYEPTANSIPEIRNKKHYEDFTKQVERWLNLKPKLTANNTLKATSSVQEFIQVLHKEIDNSIKIPIQNKQTLKTKVDALFSDLEDLGKFKNIIDFNQEFLIEEMLTRIEESPLKILKEQIKQLV